jgi:integrase
MASVRKRGDTWQARVTRKGFPDETKTFKTKAEAERWCRSIEANMDAGRYVSTREAEATLLEDLLRRYRETVTPLKRGAKEEVIRLKAMERRRIAKLALAYLTPKAVADYRDERLQDCCASTVIRDLALLSSVINHARREWDIAIQNPVQMVRKPATSQGRDRILTAEEESRLLEGAMPKGKRNPILHPLLILALETAMRRGELLSLEWKNVHLQRSVAYLPLTKNGQARWVPLSKRAIAALDGMTTKGSGRVFPINEAALHQAFRRLCTRVGIEDLRFHDLRHTGTTKLAGKLSNVIELASVTGHQSLQMLKRYYHPTAESLAAKLG